MQTYHIERTRNASEKRTVYCVTSLMLTFTIVETNDDTATILTMKAIATNKYRRRHLANSVFSSDPILNRSVDNAGCLLFEG